MRLVPLTLLSLLPATAFAQADLSVSITQSSDSALVGDIVSYAVFGTNLGPGAATGAVGTVSLPPGFVSLGSQLFVCNDEEGCTFIDLCEESGSTVTCRFPEIPAGASGVAFTVGSYETRGTKTVTGSFTADELDPNLLDNSAQAEMTVIGVAAIDLGTSQTASRDPAQIKKPLTFAIRVTNDGPEPSNGVVLRESPGFPDQIEMGAVTTSQGSCAVSGTVITCNLGALAPLSSALVQVTVTPRRADTIFSCSSVATADPAGESDTNPANDAVCIPVTAVTPGKSDPAFVYRTSETVDRTLSLPHPCSAETLVLDLHFATDSTCTYHRDTAHCSVNVRVSGTGFGTSGALYTIDERTHLTFFDTLQNGRRVESSETHTRITSATGTPARVHATMHFTLTPNGITTVSTDRERVTCD